MRGRDISGFTTKWKSLELKVTLDFENTILCHQMCCQQLSGIDKNKNL